MADRDSAAAGILDFPCDVERLANGNTLIADAGAEDGSGSEIIEVNPSGEVVWTFREGLRFAHSAKRLANGNTLIADTTNNRVIEVTAKGEVVFSSEQWGAGQGTLSDGSHLHYPNDAHLLADGSLFITDRNNDRCLQVDREGNVVWSYKGPLKHPHNCDRLENGNVTIANSDGNSALEVDRKGIVVWEYQPSESPLSWPRDADRLANGNTLITDSKNARIIEVSPAGQIVWQYQSGHYANFYDADRLENGNTLIADQQHHQVIEVDQRGKIVWSFRNYRPIRPVNERLKNTSFKKIDANGSPESWVLCTRLSEGGGKLIWSKDERGREIPGLEYDRAGALCLQQTIAALPGMRYQIAARVRTVDVENAAYVQVAFLDEMGGLTQDVSLTPSGTAFSGTCDWTLDSFEAEAPPNATAAEVRLFITGRGKVFVGNINCFA